MSMTGNKNISIMISRILRTGVFASIGISLAGGTIYLISHGNEPVTYHIFKGTQGFEAPEHVLHNIFSLHGRAIMQAGIVLLLATPVIRVIFSAASFVLEKDYLYTIITLLVLGIILFSMLYGSGI